MDADAPEVRGAVLLAGLLLAAGQAEAQELSPPAGAAQTYAQQAALDSFDLPVGAYGGPDAERTLTASISRASWRIDAAGVTVAGVIDHFEEQLSELGYAQAFRCRDDACGGFDFRFGAEILPSPAMVIDVADFAQLTMEAGDGRYASILVSRALGSVWAQVVLIAPEDDPDASPRFIRGEPSAPAEPASPPPNILPSDTASGEIAEILVGEGHVALRDLEFEVGGATLSASSSEVLDRVARALTGDPSLDVAIVGHSDTVGGFDGNLALSRQRAEAVRDALIERGVPAGRLEAKGVAYLAPLATNRTEEGRQINRRVELVLK